MIGRSSRRAGDGSRHDSFFHHPPTSKSTYRGHFFLMSRSLCGNPCPFDPALHCEQPSGHQDEFCRTRGKLTDTTTWTNPNSSAQPVPEDLFRPRPRLSAKERMKRNEAALKPMADRVQPEGRSEQPDARELRTGLRRTPPGPVVSYPGDNVVAIAVDARDTSRDAAFLALPRSGTQRMRVLEYIMHCGDMGATDEEIIREVGLSSNSERPRRLELERGEWIQDSDRRRFTASGAQAIVWVATDKARHVSAQREGAR